MTTALAIAPTTLATLLITTAVPRIGAAWPEQGGIYAGIIGGIDGAPDYHLICADSPQEIFDTNWHAAIEKAALPIDGFSDFSLPNRRESRLLFINCLDSFDKDEWYWTSEQYAADTDYAWVQDFYDGNQDGDLKSNEYRARAVRRIILEGV